MSMLINRDLSDIKVRGQKSVGADDLFFVARTDIPALLAHITEMKRKIDDVLVWYRREHASTPLAQRRNEAEWIRKLEEAATPDTETNR